MIDDMVVDTGLAGMIRELERPSMSWVVGIYSI